MAEVKLDAQPRTEFGKGASRRLRRAGRVPAVLYGHGTDPVHISLPGHETQLALRVANALLSITVEAADAQLALPKQIQRDPVRDTIEHIDLILVTRGEKVQVEVPLVVVGEPGDVNAIVMVDQQSITIEVEATNIPAQVEISVAGLGIGAQLFAKDLPLPEGAIYSGDPGDIMLSLNAPTAEVVAEEVVEEEATEGDEEE